MHKVIITDMVDIIRDMDTTMGMADTIQDMGIIMDMADIILHK